MKHRPLKARNFRSAGEDAAKTKPPSLYDGPGSAYHLAFTDVDFLLQEELRPVRVQLELMKPEMVQGRLGIESTIVLFGCSKKSCIFSATRISCPTPLPCSNGRFLSGNEGAAS